MQMPNDWQQMVYTDAIAVNPRVHLAKGRSYSFLDMASVDTSARCALATELRLFTGGGSRFAPGDTLLARITPCLENGKIARYCGPGKEAHGSTEFIVIRGRDNVTDSGYAYYLTKWEGVCGYAISQMTGTSGRQRVPTESLSNLIVPVPPLPEQRRIAHILGTLDDKIENNRKTAKTLEAIAQAIFKSWFVDFDPVRAKMAGESPESICKRLKLTPEILDLFPDRLVDSELGEIPDGWDVGVFGNLVDYLRDQENPLSYPEVTFHHFSIPAFDEGKVPKVELGNAIKSLKLLVPENVVLLSKLNPETNRVWLVDVTRSNRAVCSTEFLVLRAKPPFTRSYIYLFAHSEFFREKIEGLVTGTSKSHQRAQAGPISSIPVMLPAANVIDAFNSFTDKILLRTLECRRELTGLIRIRDALLPKLISGEIRVPEAEHLIEEIA